MKRTCYTESHIFQIPKEAESGVLVADCRRHRVSDANFYKWGVKHGSMDVSNMTRWRELEEENRRLKTMYAESRTTAETVHTTSSVCANNLWTNAI